MEIIETEKHISLGFTEFGTDERVMVCEHIDLLATEVGPMVGEYQEELNVVCKQCKKIYQFIVEVQG